MYSRLRWVGMRRLCRWAGYGVTPTSVTSLQPGCAWPACAVLFRWSRDGSLGRMLGRISERGFASATAFRFPCCALV